MTEQDFTGSIYKALSVYQAEHREKPNVILMHPTTLQQMQLWMDSRFLIPSFSSGGVFIWGIEVRTSIDEPIGEIRLGYLTPVKLYQLEPSR